MYVYNDDNNNNNYLTKAQMNALPILKAFDQLAQEATIYDTSLD